MNSTNTPEFCVWVDQLMVKNINRENEDDTQKMVNNNNWHWLLYIVWYNHISGTPTQAPKSTETPAQTQWPTETPAQTPPSTDMPNRDPPDGIVTPNMSNDPPITTYFGNDRSSDQSTETSGVQSNDTKGTESNDAGNK